MTIWVAHMVIWRTCWIRWHWTGSHCKTWRNVRVPHHLNLTLRSFIVIHVATFSVFAASISESHSLVTHPTNTYLFADTVIKMSSDPTQLTVYDSTCDPNQLTCYWIRCNPFYEWCKNYTKLCFLMTKNLLLIIIINIIVFYKNQFWSLLRFNIKWSQSI